MGKEKDRLAFAPGVFDFMRGAACGKDAVDRVQQILDRHPQIASLSDLITTLGELVAEGNFVPGTFHKLEKYAAGAGSDIFDKDARLTSQESTEILAENEQLKRALSEAEERATAERKGRKLKAEGDLQTLKEQFEQLEAEFEETKKELEETKMELEAARKLEKVRSELDEAKKEPAASS